MKYKSVIICLVLLICAALLIPSPAKSQVTVGADNGKDEEIETIEDLIGMLYCIQGGGYGSLSIGAGDVLSEEESEKVIASLISFTTANGGSEKNSAAPTKLSSEKKSKKDKEITEYDFESFTVHEYAHVATDYGSDVNSSMDRELSIYVCEELTYYRSVGRTVSHSKIRVDEEYEPSNNVIEFDMEFFMDSDEGEVYMKVNYFYMVAEESTRFSNEIIGKWILVDSPSFMSMMLSINSENLSAISEISSAIAVAYEDDEIKNKTKTKTLKKRDLGDYYDDNFKRFDVKIDITDSKSPKISLNMVAESEASMDFSASLEAIYTFENIDNTKVSMGKGVNILEIDEDDIEDYIWVED